MKYLIVLALALIAIQSAVAADTCDYQGQSYKVGDTFSQKGQCIEYTCHEGGDISAKGCAPAVGKCPPKPGDLSKPYPQCCPTYQHDC